MISKRKRKAKRAIAKRKPARRAAVVRDYSRAVISDPIESAKADIDREASRR
jgi:hypothetical protein